MYKNTDVIERKGHTYIYIFILYIYIHIGMRTNMVIEIRAHII